MCLFSNEGLSNAFPQTSQGNKARSPLRGRALGDLWTVIAASRMSPEELAAEDAKESPDTDLCSSSVPLGGEIGSNTLDKRDIERSKGESEIKHLT